MKNFLILTESIRNIEDNLRAPITRGEIAHQCHVSLSMLEKLFRYALGMSMKEYITKRRMTQAAKDLMQGVSITTLAMNYHYNSVEVFTRAFQRVWHVKPSEFTRNWVFTGIFPKINFEYREGEELYMARKRVDMSEAYEYLNEKKGSYVLCFDAKNLTAINAVSRKTGDLAILEEASRIDRVATEDMLMLRIGGDEFALITGLYSLDDAQTVSRAVLSKNGNPILFEGKELPLSLWCGITRIPEQLRYSEFFTEMHQSIVASKQ